jgi:hypothetical protein
VSDRIVWHATFLNLLGFHANVNRIPLAAHAHRFPIAPVSAFLASALGGEALAANFEILMTRVHSAMTRPAKG